MILRPLTRLTLLVFVLAAAALAAASPDPHPDPFPITLSPRQYQPHPAGDLNCRRFGVCEPCPEDELQQPFCMPFGNRRLLHCAKPGSSDEVPAWEACGKVVKKEQRGFYEFVTTNILLLVVCLTIYGVRTSALATQQYRQLAARIGIPSGAWQA